MSNTKEFHVSDVLTVTTGMLLSERGVDGVYEILNHLSGDSVYTHQIPRGLEVYAEHLKFLFPELDSPEMQFEVGRLSLMLDTDTGKSDPRGLIDGWIFTLSGVKRFYEIASAPELWRVSDPVRELVSIVGADRVIVMGESS